MLNKETTSKKDELIKLMKIGNFEVLYNKLQSRFYKLFIDIRKSDEYRKNRIKNTLNIPLEKYQTADQKDNESEGGDQHLTKKSIETLMKEWKTQNNQFLITCTVFITDDTNDDNNTFWDCLSLIYDAIVEYQLCRTSNLYLIYPDNINKFGELFPFLMTSDEKEKAEKERLKQERAKQSNGLLSITSINVKKHGIGYPNMILSDNLFLGDFHHSQSKEVFTDLGITHVVNCSKSGDIPCAFQNDIDLNVKYIRVPVHDAYDQDISEHFVNATKFIHAALNQKDEKRRK